MGARYEIPEEPPPGPLARIAVRPFWPFFGTMIGPGPLGWAWFLLNSFATRSPSRWREVVITAVGSIVWLIAVVVQMQVFERYPDATPYIAIVVITVNLGVGYALWLEQNRSFHLWERMGRPVANGLFGVVAILLLLGPMSRSALRQVGLLPARPAAIELPADTDTWDTDDFIDAIDTDVPKGGSP